MFDFSKIGMKPLSNDFKAAATQLQIVELEQHFQHPLPENYKTILKDYNGGLPKAKYFDIIDETTRIPLEWEIIQFYTLDEHQDRPSNLWWYIKNYSEYMGPNAVPFADNDFNRFYFLKWVDNLPQVWALVFMPEEIPETFHLYDSFDEFLEALYHAE